MVLIAGGIDLSVGATYALCQVIAMKIAISGNPVAAILVGLIVGIAVGAANGVMRDVLPDQLADRHAGGVVRDHRRRGADHRQEVDPRQLLGDRVRELRAPRSSST